MRITGLMPVTCTHVTETTLRRVPGVPPGQVGYNDPVSIWNLLPDASLAAG
jgi:hypothetical protein